MFTVLHVGDLTVDILLFEHLSKLVKVAIHDEAVSLPHGGSEIIVRNQLQIVGLSFPPI